MAKVTLKKSDLDRDPNLMWNAFIDVVGFGDDPTLTKVQTWAHLCFRYDGEIQNGGHLQFFVNNGLQYASEVINSLGMLGMSEFKDILVSAHEKAKKFPLDKIDSIDDFVETAKLDPFESEDNRFYEASPPLLDKLQEYAASYPNEFFVIVP